MEQKKKVNRWTLSRRRRVTALFLVLAVHAGIDICVAQEVDYSQKCCDLGNNWAKEKLRCEKFLGPVAGVPQSDQSLCLKVVDVCCKNIYREMSCEDGKSDARLGKECITGQRRTSSGMDNYRRDCCEGCKLGIFAGSRGKPCTSKNFGAPWDTTFLECCNELQSTTAGTSSITPTDQLTISDAYTSQDADTVGTTPALHAGQTTPGGTHSQITGTSTTFKESRRTSSILNSRRSSSTLKYPTPTPALDDICNLMKGQLCSEICIPTPGSYYCKCRNGSRLLEDGKTCRPIGQSTVHISTLSSQTTQQQTTLSIRSTPNSARSTLQIDGNARCPTGYRYNSQVQVCDDIDECKEGLHMCENEICYNLPGSYQCARAPLPFTRKSSTTALATPKNTTDCDTGYGPRTCPRGFELSSSGQCIDIDECRRSPFPCARSQRCVNTAGSYNCKSDILCNAGSALNPSTGRCVDIDECADGTHECGVGQTCQNRPGGYTCICPAGHEMNNKRECVDVDECKLLSSNRICGTHARCENTVGSYRCICGDGFENAPSGVCQDINECVKIPGLCQQECYNSWGSYKCACNHGYRINADNRTCADVDECEEYKERNLCVGICDNTPGSYSCRCPDGYKLGVDARICQDIDECAMGRVCRAPNEMCLNTRGSYRCNRIDCPTGYMLDSKRKNRCVRKPDHVCPRGDQACIHAPSHYSYNYLTIISLYSIPPAIGQVELFVMHSTHSYPDATIEFNMKFIQARAPPRVTPADASCFALQRPLPYQGSLVMLKSLEGPQDVELEVVMELYHPNGAFAGSAVSKIFIIVSAYEF